MNLELREESGGLRHYLDGRPVHCGTQLQLRVNDGEHANEVWVWARYESSLTRERPGVMLFTNFGCVLPDAYSVLRWPTKEAA